jgi:hypothetical protein
MRQVLHRLTLLLSIPAFAALDTTDATARLLTWLRDTAYYGPDTRCLGTGTITYQNAGYTIQVTSTCANSRVLGVWRVDEHTGALSVQNAAGKFTPPGTPGASPSGTTLTVTPSTNGTVRGFERYGIPRAPAGATYHGSHMHQGGFLAYDSWEYPKGTSKEMIARHYQRAFTTAGWRALETKNDGRGEQELSFVRLDGGSDYPTLSSARAVARASIVRISGPSSVFVEISYDETEAPPAERDAVRRILRSIGTSSSRSDAELRLRQSSVSARVLASVMRVIPVVDAGTHEVMTFDTWARRYAGSTGGSRDALLVRDPVGTTVKTLFDPSLENVAAAMGIGNVRP